MVPLGGGQWSANRMARQLNKDFFGAGCPHPAIECLASQTTKFLMHFGCETAVGRLLQVSVELFILELSMGGQPFQADFSQFGGWVMESWVKSLWEKVFLFGIVVKEGKLQIAPLRERDVWLMPLLCKLGYSSAELLRLNRVWIYQEVLFLLDVMDTRETVMDKRYEWKQPDSKSWSWFRFPLQLPPAKDFCLWRHAFLQLRQAHTAPMLGLFTGEGHKI
jgi:hypothetical protein